MKISFSVSALFMLTFLSAPSSSSPAFETGRRLPRPSAQAVRSMPDISTLSDLSRKLRVQKHVAEILTGGGIGILFGNLNAPESPERATMIMIVFAALVLGQLLRGRYEETLLGWFEGKRRR